MSSSRLLALPAELRNAIYELCVVPDATTPVNLCHTNPPSKTFLLTCRQIYSEASGIYKTAYQSYWTNTPFTLERDSTSQDNGAALDILTHLASEDLEHMQNFTLTFNCGRSGSSKDATVTMTPLPQPNMWQVIFRTAGRESRTRCFVFDRDENGRRWVRQMKANERAGGGERLSRKEQIYFVVQKIGANAEGFHDR